MEEENILCDRLGDDDDDEYTPLYIPEGEQIRLRYSSKTLTFYQNYLATSNIPEVTGGRL
jgi:hypothetical protein